MIKEKECAQAIAIKDGLISVVYATQFISAKQQEINICAKDFVSTLCFFNASVV